MTQALFTFFASYYTFVAILYTTMILWRQRDGLSRVHPGEQFSSHWWNHMTFRLFRIVIWLTTVAIAISPQLSVYYGPLTTPPRVGLSIFGIVLMVTGLALALVSNYTLASHWRSGVDNHAPAMLVQSGPYRISRNPGYIGVALGQCGFFIAYPSLFTLVCMIIGISALYRQVLFEEDHLRQRFQETFNQYVRKTPRFVSLPYWRNR
ncbi:methyltransferase family protein [Alteromonas sp. H39]|uniref:methyltransferase family protein n=1 Tax=Alteromonas sp. H39 TaxID=3389876 RepID=UPI0039E0CB59